MIFSIISGFLKLFCSTTIKFCVTPISGGYLKLGARGKNFQKLVFSKKKRVFDLALCNFSPKIIMISKKKRSSL